MDGGDNHSLPAYNRAAPLNHPELWSISGFKCESLKTKRFLKISNMGMFSSLRSVYIGASVPYTYVRIGLLYDKIQFTVLYRKSIGRK